jgi:predicted DNA-binding protein YlxM (UPF0122 family)
LGLVVCYALLLLVQELLQEDLFVPLELAGIKNISANSLFDNILNNATILALTTLNEKIELGKFQSVRKQIFFKL